MPPKSPEEARANELAQKSESMARELSQKREMRIRQERVRHLSSDDMPVAATPRGDTREPRERDGPRDSRSDSRDRDERREPRERDPAKVGRSNPSAPPARPSGSSAQSGGRAQVADDKTVRAEDASRPRPSRLPDQPSQTPYMPDRRMSMVDEVAVELEELLRDLRSGWRRMPGADKITFFAALLTLAGVLMPWLGGKGMNFQLGITSGGSMHAALAVAAIALIVGRSRRYDQRGEQLNRRERAGKSRRASLWHLLLGATSTLLCAYFLVIYGVQRSQASGLEIKYGLYVTLAAGMGLSYGGFARFWSHHEGDQR